MPLLKALNIFQSETKMHMGWYLPVIFKLQAKLSWLETSSKICLPLIRVIQDGVLKQFDQIMKDPELIGLQPMFKTTWTEGANIIEAGMIWLFNIML